MTTPCVLEETMRSLPQLPLSPIPRGKRLKLNLVFRMTKDRPVLFGALSWADVLLAHDRNDFTTMSCCEFLGMSILKPGKFLELQCDAGVPRIP